MPRPIRAVNDNWFTRTEFVTMTEGFRVRRVVLVLGLTIMAIAACGGESDDPAAPARVTTPSGLTYIDSRPGTGAAVADGQVAVVHYTGWVEEQGRTGKRFGSSHDHGEPFFFRVGRGEAIKGWDEGIVGMRVGGLRRLIVPPALVGYGDQAIGNDIPANATLIFDVELLEIRP
jgi:peptidylprolyl isomerase